MNSTQWLVRALVAVVLGVTAVAAVGQGQTQAAPAQQPVSFCGNQPLCYETQDFAATITEFRTSEAGGYKLLDAIVRFQNKINQPVILGYVDGSGTGIDDRGNRFAINSGNGGVRAMGVLYGNNIDPKFSLRPGGYSDARFEFYWREGQLQGVTYELELSIREISRMEGNQYVVAGESLLHYQGLTNGVGVAAPMAAPGGAMGGQAAGAPIAVPMAAGATQAPCNPVASATASNAAATTTNSVNNAAAALANLGSIFGHKKSATTAGVAPNTTALQPCPQGASGMTAATPASYPANTAVQQSATSTTSTVPAARAAAARSTVVAQPTRVPATVTPATTATAQKAQAPAQVKAVTPAVKAKPAPTTTTTTTTTATTTTNAK